MRYRRASECPCAKPGYRGVRSSMVRRRRPDDRACARATGTNKNWAAASYFCRAEPLDEAVGTSSCSGSRRATMAEPYTHSPSRTVIEMSAVSEHFIRVSARKSAQTARTDLFPHTSFRANLRRWRRVRQANTWSWRWESTTMGQRSCWVCVRERRRTRWLSRSCSRIWPTAAINWSVGWLGSFGWPKVNFRCPTTFIPDRLQFRPRRRLEIPRSRWFQRSSSPLLRLGAKLPLSRGPSAVWGPCVGISLSYRPFICEKQHRIRGVSDPHEG